MSVELVRAHCLSLPHVSERVQWGDNLVFKIGPIETGKLFAVASLNPAGGLVSLKCTPEEFSELVERPGFTQASHFAKTHWVAIESGDAVSGEELARLVRRSYELVFAGLPRKKREQLSASEG